MALTHSLSQAPGTCSHKSNYSLEQDTLTGRSRLGLSELLRKQVTLSLRAYHPQSLLTALGGLERSMFLRACACARVASSRTSFLRLKHEGEEGGRSHLSLSLKGQRTQINQFCKTGPMEANLASCRHRQCAKGSLFETCISKQTRTVRESNPNPQTGQKLPADGQGKTRAWDARPRVFDPAHVSIRQRREGRQGHEYLFDPLLLEDRKRGEGERRRQAREKESRGFQRQTAAIFLSLVEGSNARKNKALQELQRRTCQPPLSEHNTRQI